MLVIRFLRVGKRNQPAFKIVVTDKKSAPQTGKFIEQVGFYNPLTKEKILKEDRIKYWISVGAKPLATVHNLLVKEKIVEGKKFPVHKKTKKEKKPKEKPAPEERKEEKPGKEVQVEEKKPKEKIEKK